MSARTVPQPQRLTQRADTGVCPYDNAKSRRQVPVVEACFLVFVYWLMCLPKKQIETKKSILSARQLFFSASCRGRLPCLPSNCPLSRLSPRQGGGLQKLKIIINWDCRNEIIIVPLHPNLKIARFMNKKIWLLAFAFAFGLQVQAQGQTNGELPFLRVPRCLFFPLFAHAIGVYAGALGRGQIIDAPPAHLQEDERDDEYPEHRRACQW